MSTTEINLSELALHEKDTGSADVQIARLTQKILHLTEHLKLHKKDHHSRRGLIIMVSKRRKLLKYLDRTDHERYQKLLKALSLRR